MRSIASMIKRWDIIIILCLVFLSFVPSIIFTYIQAAKVTADSQYVAVISVNGQEVKRITLTDNLESYHLNLPEIKCNQNAIEVNNEKIRIVKSTCPEQICVKTGFISKPGRTIICLPHKVVIEVDTVNGTQEDMIISS